MLWTKKKNTSGQRKHKLLNQNSVLEKAAIIPLNISKRKSGSMPQMIIGIRLGLLPRGGNCGLRTLLHVHD